MAPMYKPPKGTSYRTIPFLSLVMQADPDFQRQKHREIEYEFSARVFVADPYRRGSYNAHSNIYPVGQAFGADDPLYAANTPLFSGVVTGGWA